MKTSFTLKRIAASTALIVAGGLLAASPAFADIKPSNGVIDPIWLQHTGYEDSTLLYDAVVGTKTKELNAGVLQFNTASTGSQTSGFGSFASYCVEASKSLGDSDSFYIYTLGSFTSDVANRLASLYQVASTAGAFTSTSVSGRAAFQLGVWEITSEAPGTAYGFSDGIFSGSFRNSSNAGITTTASSWLNQINANGSNLYSVQKYTHATYQDLLVITAVPEPETYALLLAGLGLMATIARRRKA